MSPVPAAAPQPHVRITISDPFVRTVLGPCLIGIFGLFLAGVLAIDYVLADVSPVGFSWLGLFDGLPSPFSSATVRFFEAIGSVPDVIKLPVGNLLPALVAAICFQASGISLTIVGRTLFLISVGLIAFSAAALFGLGAQNPLNFFGGTKDILVLQSFSSFAFATGLTYFGLLAGFSLTASNTAA